ncbi:MAG: acyl-CoA dehydrogenase, partial [Syntrophales bacterium]|nr:acyl-CoA dehydrogenase [Syntrophales bacterium]
RQEGGWVLDGAKDLVTNAPMAHAFLVLAWTDQGAGVEQGLSFFVVERDTPGLTIGQTLETMGLRGAPTAGITLADCRLPAEALLGEEGGGYGIFRNISEWLNLSMSAFALGVGMACMEAATRHGKQRQAFGRPIGHFEGVGAKLAIMFTYNDLGRMLTLRAAWAVDRGEEDAAVLAACAKLFTSEAVNKIANLAMQVHGGHGYLKGMDVERLYRDARFAELAYGTTEMQRAFIAKDGLARYR